MDIEALEKEAKEQAIKHVANLLQRPDQLEKVDEYKKRVARKKASVEAMLKTALQSQLDGVRSGLNQLHSSLTDIKQVKENLDAVDDQLEDVPSLNTALKSVREEQLKHSQYAAATENIKHIFNVPDSVKKCRQLISDEKLLMAHHTYRELFTSRDELLWELHKLPQVAESDRRLILTYFSELDELTEDLSKKLWLIIQRALGTARTQPAMLVTALRIIEREEDMDAAALERERMSKFMPKGRPRRWKAKALSLLAEVVEEKIEGVQCESRSEETYWLVRHLEMEKQIILEDLRVVKSLCAPCFPPHYNIVDVYVKMYHDSLSRHLQDIVRDGFEDINEYVTLLGWVRNTYPSSELMNHPDLLIDCQRFGPLLDNKTMNVLEDQYLQLLRQQFEKCRSNILDGEEKNWRGNSFPEEAGDGSYITQVPVTIFTMIEQHLEVSRTMSSDIMHKVLLLGLEQVKECGKGYAQRLSDYAKWYWDDRSRAPFYTKWVISALNDYLSFTDFARQTKERHWRALPHAMESQRAATVLEDLRNTFECLRQECVRHLLSEVFGDLVVYFDALLTREWLLSSKTTDTILKTLDDYCSDYRHLKAKNYEMLMIELQNSVIEKYIEAMLQKRNVPKTPEERRSMASQICRESNQIRQFFIRVGDGAMGSDSPCDALEALAEVLKIDDPEFLQLEVHGLIKNYPDLSLEQLTRLLALRGDINRLEVKKRAEELLSAATHSNTPAVNSILRRVKV